MPIVRKYEEDNYYYPTHSREYVTKTGDGIGSVISSAFNFVKDNASTISNVGNAVGSVASGIKQSVDAAKAVAEFKQTLQNIQDMKNMTAMINQQTDTQRTQQQQRQQVLQDQHREKYLNAIREHKGQGLKIF